MKFLDKWKRATGKEIMPRAEPMQQTGTKPPAKKSMTQEHHDRLEIDMNFALEKMQAIKGGRERCERAMKEYKARYDLSMKQYAEDLREARDVVRLIGPALTGLAQRLGAEGATLEEMSKDVPGITEKLRAVGNEMQDHPPKPDRIAEVHTVEREVTA